MKEFTYVIIGASAAGISAINTLSRIDPKASIACVADQASKPYNTCLLVDVASGAKTAEHIALRIAHQHIDFKLGIKVIAVDPERKLIQLSDNSKMLYQKLLLATGMRAIMPEIAKIGVPGNFAFYSLADVQTMHDWIHEKKVRHAIVVGAGLTGLECADALYNRGIHVTIIEKKSYVLAQLLVAQGAHVIHATLQSKGISLLLDQTIAKVIHDGAVRAVVLANGTFINTDMVIWTVGVQPNSELALSANLVMQGTYIAIDEYMQTSDPAILAAGDVAMMHGQKMKMHVWSVAVQQGSVAAHTMVGIRQPYILQPLLINSHFFGLNIAIVMHDADRLAIQKIDKEGEYLHIALENQKPVGFQFVGKKLDSIVDIRRAVFKNRVILQSY